ncbi:hypothetical protein ACIPEN_01465 [Herbaspirillum chlorophenolicum]|uniref:Uncharacterized protein n=1 Tax=Herbaspirillum chlorophenolicum TaxID=211589 RepID=A0ABW8ESP3_9BURK
MSATAREKLNTATIWRPNHQLQVPTAPLLHFLMILRRLLSRMTSEQAFRINHKLCEDLWPDCELAFKTTAIPEFALTIELVDYA